MSAGFVGKQKRQDKRMKDEAVTFDTVREVGLALPRAKEARYYGMPALKIA